MMNILITGSNGFIAKYVLEYLSKDYRVYGCGIKEEPNNQCDRYIKWDLSRDEEPKELQKIELDYIIHMAASLDMTGLSEQLINVNCFGSFNVLRIAVKHKVKRIIYFSSLPVVGNEHTVPIKEAAVFNPPTLYHATKAAGELIISQAQKYGISVVSLRVPSPIGPYMRTNTIVPVFIQRAMNGEQIIIQGKGTREQNYVDVRDISEAVKRIIAVSEMDGVYNLGSKNVISNFKLAQKCIEVLKSNSTISYSDKEDPNDSIKWVTDDFKLRTKIGDYQRYSMEDSIKDIADSMR